MEIHLDLLGGLAGDMFIAALLDAFPQFESRVMESIQALSPDYPDDLDNPAGCELIAHSDHVLQGRRFDVKPRASRIPVSVTMNHHEHASWRDIRSRLQAAVLPPGVRTHAIDIFQLLAEAEGHVHGVAALDVQFHEVGAWDSIADIVGAAALIDAIGATRWSASPAPLGSGRVRTAHGVLPVPAPATTRLLLGMPTLDDGIPGERVTPTGAAILRHLCSPMVANDRPSASSRARKLVASGTGFGSRVLLGLSNHVRALCFEECEEIALSHRRIHVLEFEIDDQCGEDLALGLDRLRAHTAVLDVTQSAVFGKKGRMMMHVQVLAREPYLEPVIDACFRETTTIGLRYRSVSGVGLERRVETALFDGHSVRVKVVERPGGPTAKAESDDILPHADHGRRAALRARAESMVLSAARTSLDA